MSGWPLVLALWAVGSAPGDTLVPGNLTDHSRALWRVHVSPRLAEPLRSDARAYDAAHVLMLPMHAAFARHYEEGERELADHAARFLRRDEPVDLGPASQLAWLQYSYLLSRFLVLAADHGHWELIPEGLPHRLRGLVAEAWEERPAVQWGRPAFRHGIRERLRWKLSGEAGTGSSYERAVLDTEIFLFAVAADLRHYGRRAGDPLAGDPLLEDIGRVALRAYRSRVVHLPAGGWLFQPGVWSEHPDYRYACREHTRPAPSPCPLPDVAEDASHSHRMPLWLRSLAGGHPAGSVERAFYLRLLDGLERQFFERVAVPPSVEFAGWRMRNYMDGRNGVYRWGYASLGPDRGYGPYELSGTLLHGWWAFLPGDRVRRLYAQLAGQFPLPADQMRLYAGPETSAGPASPGILADGTAELLTRLALELD